MVYLNWAAALVFIAAWRRLRSQIEEQRCPGRTGLGLGVLPLRMRTALANRIVLAGWPRDVRQVIDIWARKSCRLRPSLSRADGDFMAFRRFCRPFYAEGELPCSGR